jgi:hypothetical protein
MFNIATGTGTDSTAALNGFENMLEDASGTLDTNGGGGLGSSLTYGGILKSDYTWWAGYVQNGGGATYGVNYDNLTKVLYNVADGNIQPDLLVMHNNSFATYMKDQQDQQRYLKQNELDAGFLTAMCNGKVAVADLHVSDAGTTTEASNRIYWLNTDFIDFVTHSDENNRLEPFAKPVDQAVGVAHIMWAGELTSSDPGRSAIVCNFDSLLKTGTWA